MGRNRSKDVKRESERQISVQYKQRTPTINVENMAEDEDVDQKENEMVVPPEEEKAAEDIEMLPIDDQFEFSERPISDEAITVKSTNTFKETGQYMKGSGPR